MSFAPLSKLRYFHESTILKHTVGTNTMTVIWHTLTCHTPKITRNCARHYIEKMRGRQRQSAHHLSSRTKIERMFLLCSARKNGDIWTVCSIAEHDFRYPSECRIFCFAGRFLVSLLVSIFAAPAPPQLAILAALLLAIFNEGWWHEIYATLHQ